MTDHTSDPAFLYFPDNYRWSMGLLICLSGAPWGGAEIDEVNRVGLALRDKVGDDFWLMWDCWMSLDLDYAVRLASAAHEYRLKWL